MELTFVQILYHYEICSSKPSIGCRVPYSGEFQSRDRLYHFQFLDIVLTSFRLPDKLYCRIPCLMKTELGEIGYIIINMFRLGKLLMLVAD